MSPGVAMVPVLALMPVLLWVGAVCLRFRQLHQTSSLAVGVMEESYRENLECTDEDITDKVRASFPSSLLCLSHQDQADFVLVLLSISEMLRGKGYRIRWEQHCLCYPAAFRALQCSPGRVRLKLLSVGRWVQMGHGKGGGEHCRCSAGSGGDPGSFSRGSGFPQSAGRRNGLFTGSIFTSPSHKKMFSGSAFLRQPTQCERETSSPWHTLLVLSG